MIEYLKSKGIELKPAGKEFVSTCFYCGKAGHLYFNPEKEVFYCHSCSETGNIWKIKRHFGDLLEVSKVYKEKFKVPIIGIDEQYHKNLQKNDQASKYLITERGFTTETIKHFKLGFNEDSIAFPYYQDKKLVNFKYRSVEGKEFKREKDCASTIYNSDNIDKSKDLIVTEGECDCIAGWQLGFKNIVSVSIGAGSFNDDWLDFFESCSGNIYIAYDNDPKGEEGAKKLSNRIGITRCFRVKLPLKDLNDCLMAGYKKEELEKVISNAISYQPSKIKHAIDVIGEFEEMFRNGNNGKGLELGWQEFNNLMGGLRPSEITVLTGETSSGKTTFALNIFYQLLTKDKPVIILSSEMPAVKVISKLFSMHTKKKIEDFTQEDLESSIAYFSKKPLFFIDVHGEITSDDLSECLEYSKIKYGIEFVLVDHLHYLIDRKIENQFQAIEIFMKDIVKITKKLNLHIILIAHPSKLNNTNGTVSMNDLKGSSSIKQDADNIIIIWRDKEKEPDSHEVVLDVQKIRDPSGMCGSKRYDFNNVSQTYEEINDFGIKRTKMPNVPTKRFYGQD